MSNTKLRNKLVLGDCLGVLKKLPDNSIDAIVTDPPYGISFMGKDWDKAIPPISVWEECLRVLKDGAFAFIMSSPRQDVMYRMIKNLEIAGFVTGFTSIYWTYASGFPKALNISKSTDKKFGLNASISDEAKELEGSYGGYQPKPAVEVIIVVMKPLSEKTYVEQALKNKKGITWLDESRIPVSVDSDKGRYPANLIVSDNILDDGVEHQASSRPSTTNRDSRKGLFDMGKKERLGGGYPDSGSFSRYFDLDLWFRNKIKDLPSEVRKTFPFVIVSKANKSEKDKGLDMLSDKNKAFFNTAGGSGVPSSTSKTYPDGSPRPITKMKNFHPTVKPVKLMSYLIILATRKGDLVLDPYIGSGTTAIACKMHRRDYIGCDINKEWLQIALARLKAVKRSFDLSKLVKEKGK